MKQLTAYVSGKVQKTGYRARVTDIARALGFRGFVENLDDGRVRIVAEGDEDRLKWFEEAIDIKNTLIQVSTIEKEYSTAVGNVSKFYKLVDIGETDTRLDTAAVHLKDLIVAVNNLGDKLGGKLDILIEKQDQMIGKQDQMMEKQDQMLSGQREMIDSQQDLLEEVKESRKDLKGYLDQRFEKLEDEVVEMKAALREKGII
ncbi:MAG: acylphosphatase [Methanothrix sp.]